jgi:hypothetical protein
MEIACSPYSRRWTQVHSVLPTSFKLRARPHPPQADHVLVPTRYDTAQLLSILASWSPTHVMELSHICGEPWFDDGNIILLAEGVAFKVHRGVMARSSEMMQTMFSLPQPISIISDEPKIAGCSVIEMHDDPSMLGDLIRALYDGP